MRAACVLFGLLWFGQDRTLAGTLADSASSHLIFGPLVSVFVLFKEITKNMKQVTCSHGTHQKEKKKQTNN